MSKRRHFACLLLSTHAVIWAQAPPPLPPMPSEMTQQPGAPMLPPPSQGDRLTLPTSAAGTRFANLPAVAIREFRSSVNEVSPRGATDIFIAALVKSRRFRVLERARMAEGIAAEKALNQQGMTTGQTGQSQYIGAAYFFEASITEASAGDHKTAFTLGLAGAAAGQGSTTDSIAIDVRVTDVDSGVVVDAVTVRKELKSVETRVAGIGSALATLATRGRGSGLVNALAPADEYVNARKDSLDRGLREAIDEAVGQLVKRFGNDP